MKYKLHKIFLNSLVFVLFFHALTFFCPFPSGVSINAIPLVDIPEFFYSIEGYGLRTFATLYVFLSLSILTYFFPSRATLIFVSIATLLFFILRFSISHAFLPFVPLLFLFSSLIWKVSTLERRKAAYLTLGFIYVGASIAKMNPFFLSGWTFTPDSPFYLLSRHEIRPFYSWISSNSLFIVLIILIQILTSIFLFYQKKIGVLFALFLPLVLSFFFGRVFIVFLTLLPLCLIIIPRLAQFFFEGFQSFRNFKIIFFILSFLFIVSFPKLGQYFYYMIFGNFIVLCFSKTTFFHIKKIILDSIGELSKNPQFLLSKKSPLITNLSLLYSFYILIGYLFQTPEPISFMMFSGRDKEKKFQEVRIQSSTNCDKILNRYAMGYTNGTKLVYLDNEKCLIHFPTNSGINFILRKL